VGLDDRVAGDRTLVTELATGLGMLGIAPPVLAGQEFLADSPLDALCGVDAVTWQRLRELLHDGSYHRDAALALGNGAAFLHAPDALAGRPPRRIEWTGARRPPGDETIPADLRVDHVYLVSCKYLSKLLHNAAPARLFEGLLADDAVATPDWFAHVAPREHQALYDTCRHLVLGLPVDVGDLDPEQRRRLALAVQEGWPPRGEERYHELAGVVAAASAARWKSAVERGIGAERMVWRLLRIAAAPYFVLGTQRGGSMRLRIDTPWDWHHRYALETFDIAPTPAGQPQVSWSAKCHDRVGARHMEVRGHVEIRWSHGRFRQAPEAKVYLDTPHHLVPGYHELPDC
jgi:hypothetical protein